MNDENRDCLAELAARFHNTEAQWDDFGCEEKVDDFGAVVLYECANDTERSQAQVFEGPGFRRRVEKRVEEERDVSCARRSE